MWCVGFYRRASYILGLIQDDIKKCLARGYRVIFTGHSLGGAVAHIILANIFVNEGAGI